jgi:hypothetical protein
LLDGDPRSRQRLLPEVGARGQALIERSHAVVGRDATGDVTRVYLSRAGVTVESCVDARSPAFAHAALFRHAGPGRVAEGAHRALLQLREVLGIAASRARQRTLHP